MWLQQHFADFIRWLQGWCRSFLGRIVAMDQARQSGTCQPTTRAPQTRAQSKLELNGPADLPLRSQGLWDDEEARQSNYWAASSASAETLWQMVVNLADMATWHPSIGFIDAPYGQRAKPGLIYRIFSRRLPLATKVFVERVLPGELLSIRLFPLPGLQERVTYRIVSTLFGTCVLYSITLSGWLSPLVWPMLKPQAPRVATALVQAAEQAAEKAAQQFPPANGSLRPYPQKDIF